MQKEHFAIIENNLKERITNCQKHLDHIITTEDLKNITIKEFISLKSFCIQEVIDMTEILMVDLYHVLGMGKLTLQQRNTFISLLNEYSTYRSDMKCISQMTNVENLPKLPSRSKYKLHKLGDLTLESESRGSGGSGEVHDETSECSLDNYHNAKVDDKTRPITYDSIKLEGCFITFNVKDILTVMEVLPKNAKAENLLAACDKKNSYCDIIWTYTDTEHTQVQGVFGSNSSRDSARSKFRNIGVIV